MASALITLLIPLTFDALSPDLSMAMSTLVHATESKSYLPFDPTFEARQEEATLRFKLALHLKHEKWSECNSIGLRILDDEKEVAWVILDSWPEDSLQVTEFAIVPQYADSSIVTVYLNDCINQSTSAYWLTIKELKDWK